MKTRFALLLFLIGCFAAPTAFAAKPARENSGADSESGWIIRKTPQGVVKVPRKQSFKFDSAVEGQGAKPAQSIIGQRPPSRETTLIPVKQSFRQDVLDSVGYRSK